MASPLEKDLLAPSSGSSPKPERLRSTSDNRRTHKKQRCKKPTYHWTEKELARRREAKRFLSSIPLDARVASYIENQRQLHPEHFQPKLKPRSTPAAEEGLKPSSQAEKLHEMVNNLEIISHHSPVKVDPSKSLDYGLSHGSGSGYDYSPLLSRSASMHQSGATPTYEQKRSGFLHGMPQTKSLGSSVDGGGGDVHYCTSLKKLSQVQEDNKRVVLAVSGAPVLVSSTIGYKRELPKLALEHPQRQRRTRVNSMSLQFDLDVELGCGEEVSLTHLFAPTHQLPTEFDPSPFHSTIGLKPRLSDPLQYKVFTVEATYNEVLDQLLPIPCGDAFPWAGFRDHHSTNDVLVHYHPLCLDNSEYFVGPNISTLSVQSYRVSFLQYTKVPDVKKTINDQFSETFPHIKITLSKLRSIKKEMYNIAKEKAIDTAAVAHAYVYFEKLVLMGKVHKSNRNMVAGVCLLLAAKFFTDMKKQEIKDLLDEITDVFRLSSEELVLYELPVLVGLQFSLLTPIIQTFTHFEKLRDRDISKK